ncbi:MAG TPA: 6-hydroxycyclohex-1-ene-1-carbonyl-CoA dehydrogenase [Vicinamibacterales bacterium]|nr:6-hydroxycyclohex-1-ene-1-carbonyl-CoA dehydrogenase [Vicinamibacterales bacterium]
MSRSSGLFLTAPAVVELREFDLAEPQPGEVVVRVAGCGVCHTDVSFASGSVRTRHPLPLVLGHEISGVVVEAPPPHAGLVGRQVIVPAVIPCGECPLCRAGRDTACQRQMMPGNDLHGGFASHAVVPARYLSVLPDDLRGYDLADLSVIADAVTTPLQALKRGCVQAGDLVVVIGVGGIGTFALQIAAAFGARTAGVDIDPVKRERAAALGAAWVFDPAAADARAIKKTLTGESDVCSARWRILEMSGTARGQELAWALLPPAATLGVIGFTMDKPDIRLSNLMALDATAFGSWGCSPRHYAEAVDLVLAGQVELTPFIEKHPLANGPALLADPHGTRRPILVP